MKNPISLSKLFLLLTGLLTGGAYRLSAQSILDNPVTLKVERQPVVQVLHQLSTQGNFYFSYASNVIRNDSLVSISVERKPVRTVLDQLFAGKVTYRESANYIILLPSHKPVEKFFIINGKIIDGETRQPLDFASIYTQDLQASALSNDDGGFRLRVKETKLPQRVTLSKLGYQDSTFVLNHGTAPEGTYVLYPKTIILDELVVGNKGGARNFLLRLLVSSRLRMTSQNLGQFFVNLPYQLSLTPGLGTHGRMASQIVNKVSINLIGGYTAGTNGLEMAGVFNISKHDVQYVQLAGIFNMVSGSVKGVQVAGIHNSVQREVSGVQASGMTNVGKGYLRGAQLAGIGNKAQRGFSGAQLAGVFNISKETTKGVQIALFNSANHLNGVQIGIINRTVTSEGFSFGLINLVKYGQSLVSLSTNELTPAQIAWKTGTHKLYVIVSGGMGQFTEPERILVSWGMGTTWPLGKKMTIQLEALQQTRFQGDLKDNASSTRFQIPFNYFITPKFAFFGGPALTWLYDEKAMHLGWQGGVSLYYKTLKVE